MSLNPLNELKRRLDDEATPMPKRLCLAKNIVQSYHFPMAPKERIVGDWLQGLMEKNGLTNKELKNILEWLSVCDDLTGDLKSSLIKIVSQYVQTNPLENNDIIYISTFLESNKIRSQLHLQIDDYLTITVTLLQCLKDYETLNVSLSQKLLNNLIKYYKECKKKLEFIIKLLKEVNLDTLFSYLDTDCRNSVIDVCQNILFPINKKSFFISYLQTLIRKDNLDELIAEKGDNIQSVLKIMNAFFELHKSVEKNPKYIKDFMDVFVTCFRSESQIIFAFYIMVVNFLNMKQNYITPAMSMPTLSYEENDEKAKRNLFLNMLEIILQNEVDMSVRLTDTFGEKISKIEIKKNFMSFLQAVMMGQLKLEGKLDTISLKIIKTALKLDPILIEQKITEILPPIMTAKKNNLHVAESYMETLNCLIEILFKLSRGVSFVNQILPYIKLNLEACNTEQFEYKQKVMECTDSGFDCEKMKNKIITGRDVFPQECVELYGKLTSELMFRQNKELLESLQKDFEEHCLMMLEEGFVSPSIITLAEVLSAILSSFFRYNKMADHTVPLQIAEDFWDSYKKFEDECLKKFGECVLKLDYSQPLALSYLQLCSSFAQLKLLNMKYSHVKLGTSLDGASDVFDLSSLLPCLTGDQWATLASKVQDNETVLILDNLLLLKTMAIKLKLLQNSEEASDEAIIAAKSHLIKQISLNPDVLDSNYFAKVLFNNLDRTQNKQLAKFLVKLYLNNPETEIFKCDAVNNNGMLLNSLVLETVKNINKCFQNCDQFTKALNKDFNMASFAKNLNMKEYLNQFNTRTLIPERQETIKIYIDLIKQLQVPFLEENYQLVVILALLAIKKCCHTKKLQRSIDYVLQSIYELSLQPPDLYQIFPVNVIFSFDDKMLLDLLTLKIKTSNKLLIIKSILDSAVKRVRIDSGIVKSIVDLLLTERSLKSVNIDIFSDPAFQLSCLILPLIVKQKKAITASAFRSILADLQEKLHKALLESFKNIDFSQNSSFVLKDTSNTEDSAIDSDSNLATLNAMAAYSLTLSKYCETTDVEEIRNLDCLWSGLEYFIQNAIQTIQEPSSKIHHIEPSLQLINITLRHVKKLETHDIFQDRDKLFVQMWRSVKSRLLIMYGQQEVVNSVVSEEVSVTLKFLCELSSVEWFVKNFIGDLAHLAVLKNPSLIIKDDTKTVLTSHKVCKYLWCQCLRANTVGPKCVALSKQMFRACQNLRSWIRQHYDADGVAIRKRRKLDVYSENDLKTVHIEDEICQLLRVDMDALSEVIMAAKKISLDYKFLDTIFELQHMLHYILGCKKNTRFTCQVRGPAYFDIFDGCVAVLNSLLVSREEMLEDRWPCFMQCYRALVTSLCERSSSSVQLEKGVEQKLAETAHNIEKLTQSISKRKKHVSRISAYTVGDVCSLLERTAPTRMVRQHLENCVALLIQASDSTYAMAFLKRALAGSPGQMTMANLYTMYKRYHKYVGNA